MNPKVERPWDFFVTHCRDAETAHLALEQIPDAGLKGQAAKAGPSLAGSCCEIASRPLLKIARSLKIAFHNEKSRYEFPRHDESR
jgi:hypothetical protein